MKLLELARGDSLLGVVYRVYLHVKHFIFYNLGFNIATWYSGDGKIESCDVISQQDYDFFTKSK